MAFANFAKRKMRIKPLNKTVEMQNVTTSYLKMTKAPEPSVTSDSKYSVERLASPINPAQYIKHYRAVGDAFQWLDRLVLSTEELTETINRSKNHACLLKLNGDAIGFSELVQEKDYVEVLYFGLFTRHIGQGHGSKFLDMMISKAWSLNPQWIQLNTCTLDHPKALTLYQQKGFEITKTITKQL